MKQNEYTKTCPHCKAQFEATHLSRLYCSERCKRRAFREKKQEIRNKEEQEKDQYLKNNRVLTKLYRPDHRPYKQKDLINAGYNDSYMKDRIIYEGRLLVTYEDHFLEILNNDIVIIHKKM